jgi:hypothetical protein
MTLHAFLFFLYAVTAAVHPTHHRPAANHVHQHGSIHRGECRENHRNYQDPASGKQWHDEISSIIPGYTVKNWNDDDSWLKSFTPSTHIKAIHPNNLFFLDSTMNMSTAIYWIWDIFLREDKIVVLSSRYLPIALQEIYFTIDSLSDNSTALPIDTSHLICTSLPNWPRVNPNEVIIAYYSNPQLVDYLKTIQTGEKIKVKLHLYAHTFEYTVEKLVSPQPAPLPPRDPKILPPSLIPAPSDSSSSTASPIVYPPMVAVTLIGDDILVQEVITWMTYHEAVGIHNFYIYYCVSITSDWAKALTTYASECVSCHITVLSWYPFWVNIPSSRSHSKQGSSQLAVIQSGLFRLRTTAYPIWMVHNDIDEYLVVHPKYSSLPDMFTGFPSDIAAVFFHNAYFFIPPSLSLEDRNKSIPTGYTWKEFLSHPIVYEKDLRLYNFRPKMMCNIQKVISIGGHRVDLSEGPSKASDSGTFYLHFARLVKGRDSSIVQNPVLSNLTVFLTTPRPLDMLTDGMTTDWNVVISKPGHNPTH